MTPNHLSILAQDIEDLQKIDEAVETTRLTGWDIAAIALIVLLTWPVALFAGTIARRVLRRVERVPDYVPPLADRAVRAFVVFIALALVANLLGIDIGWFTLIVAGALVVAVLMLRPLIENLAAGLLLQSRPSFSIGDEIETNGHRGQVAVINARSTVIQTGDLRRIHVPNQDVLDDSIVVFTAFERRRSQLDLEVEYAADPDETTSILVAAAASVEGVHADPPPSVLAKGFGTGTVMLSLSWWHDPDLSSGSRTLDGVVRAVKAAVDDAGIDMPSPEMIVRQPDIPPGDLKP